MRAISPLLSDRTMTRRRRRRTCPLRKSPEDELQVLVLLQDMSLCYRLLHQLVPDLPSGRTVSRMEILQSAINYILDLQTQLDGDREGDGDQEETFHRDQTKEQQQQSCRTNTQTHQSRDVPETESEVEDRRKREDD